MENINIVMILLALAVFIGILMGQKYEASYGAVPKLLKKALESLGQVQKLIKSHEVPMNADALQAQIDILKIERDMLKSENAEIIEGARGIRESWATAEALYNEGMRLATEEKVALEESFESIKEQLQSTVDRNTGLVESVDGLEQQLSLVEGMLQNIEKVAKGTESSEAPEAIDAVLKGIGNPQSDYEMGVYNGVVSVANTLYGADYVFVTPQKSTVTFIPDSSIPKGVIVHKDNFGYRYSKRGAGGKFVKKGA